MELFLTGKAIMRSICRSLFSLAALSVCVQAFGQRIEAAEFCDWLQQTSAIKGTLFCENDTCTTLADDCCSGMETSELCGSNLLERLTESGITFSGGLYQMYQGVAAGGVRREFEYGGHGNYVATFDLDKLAGQKGLFLKLRAEHRFGMQGGPPDGAILPSAIPTSLPADTESLVLTNVLFTQFLNENMAVSFGKLDTFDGDQNAFASGRGTTQFSNVAMVVNPVTFRTAPYSTLGVNFSYMLDLEPIFSFSVLNSVDTATTAGFDELFSEGATLVTELRLPTDIAGKPGHQLLGVSWSSRTYADLGSDPRLILTPEGIPQTTGSWAVYWNADQYLVYEKDSCTSTARGWGVFGRAGIADRETNPIEYFLSFGVGGNAMIRGREQDYFGIGWYQTGTSSYINDVTAGVLDLSLQGQGIELYYRIQATEHLQITPDIQINDPARNGIDTAYLFGVRALLSF